MLCPQPLILPSPLPFPLVGAVTAAHPAFASAFISQGHGMPCPLPLPLLTVSCRARHAFCVPTRHLHLTFRPQPWPLLLFVILNEVKDLSSHFSRLSRLHYLLVYRMFLRGISLRFSSSIPSLP